MEISTPPLFSAVVEDLRVLGKPQLRRTHAQLAGYGGARVRGELTRGGEAAGRRDILDVDHVQAAGVIAGRKGGKQRFGHVPLRQVADPGGVGEDHARRGHGGDYDAAGVAPDLGMEVPARGLHVQAHRGRAGPHRHLAQVSNAESSRVGARGQGLGKGIYDVPGAAPGLVGGADQVPAGVGGQFIRSRAGEVVEFYPARGGVGIGVVYFQPYGGRVDPDTNVTLGINGNALRAAVPGKPVGTGYKVRRKSVVAQIVGHPRQAGQARAVAVVFGAGGQVDVGRNINAALVLPRGGRDLHVGVEPQPGRAQSQRSGHGNAGVGGNLPGGGQPPRIYDGQAAGVVAGSQRG